VHVKKFTRYSGRVAYCSDRPWIINASVRDNIVLGASSAYRTSSSSSTSGTSSSASEERYTAVVAACALDVDMAEWPAGDSTIIGEKGNLNTVFF
jgi:ABC-type multidrug transport system fused ATPase/permease subunit